MNLRAAIGWSVAFHLALLKVYLPHGTALPAKAFHSIEVVVLPVEPRPSVIRPVPKSNPLAPAGPSMAHSVIARPAQAGRSNLKSELPRSVRSGPGLLRQPEVYTEGRRSELPRNDDAAGLGTVSSLPEGEFASLQHKKQIREHLRAYLYYPEISSQGMVRLHLTLHPDGRLQEARIIETSDSGLAEAALDGARSADPYPSSPEEMKPSDAEYEFLVQYRPE